MDDAIEYGVGRNYLIEHSPGSGKTKTITWTAFRLTEIREPNGKAVFDTILIITDRTNLNDQLLAAVNGFNRTPGLVQGIDRKAGTSKTASLQKALEKGVRIVVVTIQTFPFAMEGSVRISVSGEVIPGAAQRGCPLYLRCSMPDLMR